MNVHPSCAPVEAVWEWYARSPKILVGIGAGLSASAGLNYADEDFFQTHYPQYAARGFKTILHASHAHWDVTPENRTAYWAFWAWHIRTIYYAPPALPPYADLARLLQTKAYCVITTNVDGQVHKVGLDEQRLFIPQGEYGLCQCPLPCCEAVYPNKPWVEAIIRGTNPLTLRAREEDIPRCPHCGRFLIPNLRKDDHFVDALYQEGYPRYRKFLETAFADPVLLLELGVGYNTPGIIRYPFEFMTGDHPQTRLVRVNMADSAVPPRLGDRARSIAGDSGAFLRALVERLDGAE